MEPRETWDHVAPAWERHRARLFEERRAVSEWLVEQVEPGPGRTILEITAGPGETSFLAAERGARVICTDFSPHMVEAARRGATARGLASVECREMDAHALDLPDDSVDGALSRYGMMLLPDPAAAAAEARRVLRPDGVFAYAVWGPPDRNLWIVMLGATLLQGGHELPGDAFGPGGMFSLAAPGTNHALLADSGFGDVHVELHEQPLRFESFDDYWTVQCEIAGPIAVILSGLPHDEIAAIRGACEETVAPFRSIDGRLEFPAVTVLARGAST